MLQDMSSVASSALVGAKLDELSIFISEFIVHLE